MTKSISLEEALAMHEAGTGPSEELQRRVPLAFIDRDDYQALRTIVSNACGESSPLDACFVLLPYLLPEANWIVAKGKTRPDDPDEPPFGVCIFYEDNVEFPIGEGESDNLALAFLRAIFRALIVVRSGTRTHARARNTTTEDGP